MSASEYNGYSAHDLILTYRVKEDHRWVKEEKKNTASRLPKAGEVIISFKTRRHGRGTALRPRHWESRHRDQGSSTNSCSWTNS